MKFYIIAEVRESYPSYVFWQNTTYLSKLEFIDWDMISALASWIEIIILFIPAAIYFFYSKICFANYWIFDQTCNGMKVAVHNKSKLSLFILNHEIIVKKNQASQIYPVPIQNNGNCNYIYIKPDETININIDYAAYNILPSDQVTLYIYFGGKRHKRKIKIKKRQLSCM